jgi:hypothetical protein
MGEKYIQPKNSFGKLCKEREGTGMFCSALQKAQRVDKARERGAERCRISKELAKHLLTIIFTVKIEAQMVNKALRNIPMRCRIPKALTKDRRLWCNSCAYHSR